MARRLVLIGATVLAVVATTVAVQTIAGAPQARADGLVPYAGCDDYLAQVRKDLQASSTPFSVGAIRRTNGSIAFAASATTEVLASTSDAAGQEAVPGPTGTNLQESGVDEPDLAKLADGRVVAVHDRVLRVWSAGPKPVLLGSLPVADEQFATSGQGSELLVVGDRALVVQSGTAFTARTPQETLADAEAAETAGAGELTRRADKSGRFETRVVLVDLAGGKPVVLDRATYDGTYVSARLRNGTVRLVTSFEADVAGVVAATGSPASDAAALAANKRLAGEVGIVDALPHVTRGEGSTAVRTPAVDCEQISHPREDSGSTLLVVTTLRPADGLDQVDRDAVTAGGDLVYASTDRLYVATSRQIFTPTAWPLPMSANADTTSTDPASPASPTSTTSTTSTTSPTPALQEPTTEIHAFDTTGDRSTKYVASGSVPGLVIGRWAFSEYQGTLRVATTRQPNGQAVVDDAFQTSRPNVTASAVSSSMVVKLRENEGALVETSRIAGLGKTEEIKSVRYMGELAAVVTFRQTDPLYLVDLGATPHVVGELKVPGYSTYLQPIGDGKVLSIGMQAVREGFGEEPQVSVFDIADPSKPRLVDRLYVGAGESPAVTESRAFTYDASRRVLLLPFTPYDYTSTEVQAIRVGTDGKLTRAATVAVRATSSETGVQGITRVLTDTQNFYGVEANRLVTGDLDTLQRTS